MNKLLFTVAVTLAIGGNAMAHHPAADIVDPEIYEMIDENVSDVHAEMTFDDMGGDTSDIGNAMVSRNSDVGNRGEEPGGDLAEVGAAFGGDTDAVGAASETREEMNSMADREPGGPGRRSDR